MAMRNAFTGKLLRALIVIVLIPTIIEASVASSKASKSSAKQDVGKVFEERYQRWVRWRKQHLFLSCYTGCREFHEIVKLGPKAIPFIIAKMKESGDFFLASAVLRITKYVIPENEWPKGMLGDSKTAAKLYIRWWEEGRREIPKRFEKLYARWKKLIARGETTLWMDAAVYNPVSKRIVIRNRQHQTPLGQTYEAMRNLGIEILPLLIEKFKEGDWDLLPLFGELTDGKGVIERGYLKERVAFTLKWWEKNKEDWLLPKPEQQRDRQRVN